MFSNDSDSDAIIQLPPLLNRVRAELLVIYKLRLYGDVFALFC